MLSAPLIFATAARADVLKVTGFAVGSQTVSLVSPSPFVSRDVHAGAFNLNPPAGILAYCIDIFQTIGFGALYSDYTTTSLATDASHGRAQGRDRAVVPRLLHDLADERHEQRGLPARLVGDTVRDGSHLNVDGGDLANRGVTYATSRTPRRLWSCLRTPGLADWAASRRTLADSPPIGARAHRGSDQLPAGPRAAHVGIDLRGSRHAGLHGAPSAEVTAAEAAPPQGAWPPGRERRATLDDTVLVEVSSTIRPRTRAPSADLTFLLVHVNANMVHGWPLLLAPLRA